MDINCTDILKKKLDPTIEISPSIADQIACSEYFYDVGVPFNIERIAVITIFFTGIVMGLAGNITVFLASLNYNSFKMDRITILFVKVLAFSDLFYIIIFNIPLLITAIAKKWILGKIHNSNWHCLR